MFRVTPKAEKKQESIWKATKKKNGWEILEINIRSQSYDLTKDDNFLQYEYLPNMSFKHILFSK